METWVIDAMRSMGYVIVFLLIAVENIFPPIPSEVILTAGGFLTTGGQTTMNVWGVVIASTLGSVAGALVLYGVGRWLNPERLERWINGRVGKLLRLKATDVEKAQGWFDKHGKKTVFFCRFIPVVRSLISIPAGIAHMSMPIFLLLTTIGTAIWNIVLVNLGAAVGESWHLVSDYMGIYSKIGIVTLGVVGVILVGVFYYKRLKEKKNNESK